MKIMKNNPGMTKTLIKISAALAGGTVLFVLVIGLATAGFRSIYKGRIFPGIYLGWVNLSGQTPEDAARLISDEFGYTAEGQITLQYG